jgi:hypothetical protein
LIIPLLEGVGPGAPPREEHGQTKCLDNLGEGAYGNGIDGTLLGEELIEVLEERVCQSLWFL